MVTFEKLIINDKSSLLKAIKSISNEVDAQDKTIADQKKWDLSLVITGGLLEKGFENELNDIIKSKIKIVKKIKLDIKKKNILENIPSTV